jgi:Uma2 family endonuclease
MTSSVTLAKWTLEQYHQMIAAGILDNQRVELLHGEIVKMAPKGQNMPRSVPMLLIICEPC